MILREATLDDLDPLIALCRKPSTSPKNPILTDLDRLRAARAHRWRIVVARDSTLPSPLSTVHSPRVLAALSALPTDTADGPGYTIDLYVTDRDQPDPRLALDAVSLYACTLANSEGRHVIVTRPPTATHLAYARDTLAMRTFDHAAGFPQIGDARVIAAAILRRRPQWVLSL